MSISARSITLIQAVRPNQLRCRACSSRAVNAAFSVCRLCSYHCIHNGFVAPVVGLGSCCVGSQPTAVVQRTGFNANDPVTQFSVEVGAGAKVHFAKSPNGDTEDIANQIIAVFSTRQFHVTVTLLAGNRLLFIRVA